ncbi:ankyrin repeat-containing domain protein [Xylariomycetidae sp. FL2044]|nr:ankyrin repeat-containing domain protein [Xylariomycetidae sp. FL2044]
MNAIVRITEASTATPSAHAGPSQDETLQEDHTVGGWPALAAELLALIAEHLPQSARFRMAQVCKRWSHNIIPEMYRHDEKTGDCHALWWSCEFRGTKPTLSYILAWKPVLANYHFKRNHSSKQPTNLSVANQQSTEKRSTRPKGKWQTPLSIAVRAENRKALKTLLENGADPNLPDRLPTDGHALCWYPIHWAVRYKRDPHRVASRISMLGSFGADMNRVPTQPHPDSLQYAPDPEAILQGYGSRAEDEFSPIFHILQLRPPSFRGEAMTSVFNGFYTTVLEKRNEQLVELLQKGANPNLRHSGNGFTPLFYLIHNIYLWEPSFHFPIGYATKQEREEQGTNVVLPQVVKFIDTLVRFGANVNQFSIGPRKDGDITPLHLACCLQMSFRHGVVAKLLESGAEVNAESNHKRTPLFLMFDPPPDKFNVALVGWFIENGANVNHQDKEGNTALHILCRSITVHVRHRELVIKALLKLKGKHALDLTVKNHAGETVADAAHNCEDRMCEDMAILLKEEMVKRGKWKRNRGHKLGTSQSQQTRGQPASRGGYAPRPGGQPQTDQGKYGREKENEAYQSKKQTQERLQGNAPSKKDNAASNTVAKAHGSWHSTGEGSSQNLSKGGNAVLDNRRPHHDLHSDEAKETHKQYDPENPTRRKGSGDRGGETGRGGRGGNGGRGGRGSKRGRGGQGSGDRGGRGGGDRGGRGGGGGGGRRDRFKGKPAA